MRCSTCGEDLREHESACPTCGAMVSAAPVVKPMGFEVRSCPRCGHVGTGVKHFQRPSHVGVLLGLSVFTWFTFGLGGLAYYVARRKRMICAQCGLGWQHARIPGPGFSGQPPLADPARSDPVGHSTQIGGGEGLPRGGVGRRILGVGLVLFAALMVSIGVVELEVEAALKLPNVPQIVTPRFAWPRMLEHHHAPGSVVGPGYLFAEEALWIGYRPHQLLYLVVGKTRFGQSMGELSAMQARAQFEQQRLTIDPFELAMCRTVSDPEGIEHASDVSQQRPRRGFIGIHQLLHVEKEHRGSFRAVPPSVTPDCRKSVLPIDAHRIYHVLRSGERLLHDPLSIDFSERVSLAQYPLGRLPQLGRGVTPTDTVAAITRGRLRHHRPRELRFDPVDKRRDAITVGELRHR